MLNIAHYLDVPGTIDPSTYRSAWVTTVDEIDALHATFGEDADGPYQLVADGVEWDLREVDLRDESDPEASARAWMDADLRSLVDLATPPLMTLALLRVADDRTFCYQRIHHLVLDGYGATLAMLRANAVYNALVNGADPGEPFTGPIADLVADDQAYGPRTAPRTASSGPTCSVTTPRRPCWPTRRRGSRTASSGAPATCRPTSPRRCPPPRRP